MSDERSNIRTNVAKCNACGDVIESKYRHDWVQCTCGSTYVDGGREYLRRGYSDKGYTELATYYESTDR